MDTGAEGAEGDVEGEADKAEDKGARGQGGGKFHRAKNEEKSPHELEIIFFSDLFVGGEIVNFES